MCLRISDNLKSKLAAIAAFGLAFVFLRAPAARGVTMDDVSKELEYVDALVKQGADSGDIKTLATADRTLANLAVTSDRLGAPRDKALTNLSIAYFYVRMCGTLPLLELSKTSNPDGVDIDCVQLSEQYFDKAIEIANANLKKSEAADTYFYAGLGYDALRGFLSAIPGRDNSDIFKKAEEHVSKAVELGTSFDGAKNVLAKFSGASPAGGMPIISGEIFLQIHRLFYMQRVLTPPGTLDYLKSGGDIPAPTPADAKNTYMDFKWRFSIKKPDDNWEFATSSTHTNFRVSVQQKRGQAAPRPPLTLVAHELTNEERMLNLGNLVARSSQVLLQAGYVVDSQSQTDFKGKPAYEIVLTSTYKDIEMKESNAGISTDSGAGTATGTVGAATGAVTTQPPKPLATKHYMFIVLSGGIEYILSFNTIVEDYARAFPDLKMIANTFTPF